MANIRQKVALEGVRFFSYHGFYAEEQILGNEYLLDIETESEVTDHDEEDMSRTVNYERLLIIAQEEMAEPRKLLETVAHGILRKIRHEFLPVVKIRVVIRKLRPPLSAEVKNSVVELNFTR